MRDRPAPRLTLSSGRLHKTRRWPRRGRSAHRQWEALSDVPRLGVDLHAHITPTHDAYTADDYTQPQPRIPSLLAWRLSLPRLRERIASLPLKQRQPSHPAAGRSTFHSALIVAFVIQLLLATAAIWTVSTWQVRHIRIQGSNDPLVTQHIAALPLANCLVIRCDLAHDTALVEALPAVASAALTTALPDVLIVTVTLRTPALIWATDAGSLVLASDGVVLGSLESDPAYAALHLPTIADSTAAAFSGTLPTAGAKIDANLVYMAEQLRNGLVAALGEGSTLRYAGDTGLTAITSDGTLVLFGDARAAAAMLGDDASVQALGASPPRATVAQGVRLQLDAARSILQVLTAYGQSALTIDLRWGSHPYVLPRNG